jgi:two-component system, NarL family, response regulator
MNDPVRIVIADDHPVIRAGLCALLSSHGDFVVAGEAANGLEAVEVWHEMRPDVGLFDLRMPGLDGLEALQRIREHQPQAPIVILTTIASEADMDRAVAAGANAYLPKEATMTEIVGCIEAVRHGAPYVHAGVQKRLIERALEEPLTPREGEVLAGIAHGWSNRRVADELKIAEGTIKTHLKRIFGKLYARNRTEAVVIARRKGLLRTQCGAAG